MAREWIAVSLLVAAALALRLPNLGRLGLVADEGHQALAVAGILEHGVPEVPSGAVYMRGLPFIYAEAAAGRVFGVDEMSLRLPAAVFGALTVGLIYAYGRMLFGFPTALIAGLLLTFSLWELELAHYARMYTLFQLAFLGSAIGFYQGVIKGRRGYRPLTFALMAITLVTHQLGIFILGFFLLPAFLPDEALPEDLRGRRRWRLLVPALALGILGLGYQAVESHFIIRNLTPVEGPPAGGGGEGAEPAAGGSGNLFLAFVRDRLLVPRTLLPWELRAHDRPAVAAAFGLAAALGVAVMTTLAKRGRGLRTLWGLAILGAAFMNQFAVAAGLAAAYLILLPGGFGEFRRRPLGPALVGVVVLGLYWGLYLIRHPEALSSSWQGPHSIGAALAGYPPVRERVLHWFWRGWPVMTVVVLVTLAVLLIQFIGNRRRTNCLYAAAAVLMPVLGVAATREIFNESRYHFHLYPFLVVLFAYALASAARFLTAAADTLAALAGRRFPGRRAVEGALVMVLALLCSPDVSPTAIVHFLNRDYTTPKDPVRSILNWSPYASFHQDHAGPASFVRAQLKPDDRILVVGPTYWNSIYWHYLGRMEYAVSEKAERLVRNGVTVHHVTGARCITSVDELEHMLAAESGRRLWILGDLHLLGDQSRYFSPPMKAKLREFAQKPLLLGRDLDTFVARRDPLPERDSIAGQM